MPIYCPLCEALGIMPPDEPIKYSSDHYFDPSVPSPFKGQKHTEETKMLISLSHKGKVYSQVTIERMSKAKLGKKASKDTKEKMSIRKKGELNHFYGKKHSAESKERNRISHLGKTASKETKELMSKQRLGRKWYNDGTNEYFASIDNIKDSWKPGRLKRK